MNLTHCHFEAGSSVVISLVSRVIAESQTDALSCKRENERGKEDTAAAEIENVIAMVFAHRHRRPTPSLPPILPPRTHSLRACGHVKVEGKWPKSTARRDSEDGDAMVGL